MGNVPKVRFPEFSGEWEENYLKELVDISNVKVNPKTHKTSYRCIELENLSSNDGILLGYGNSRTQESIKNKFFKGQILYGKLRPYLRKYWKAEFDGLCSSEIWVLIGKKISNNFLYYIVQGSYFNEIANISTGSKMPRADWNHMRETLIKTPSEAEQTKIANFLTLYDKKIKKQAEKVAALEEYKKGLMQKIFSREIRFKDDGGNNYPEWEKVSLSKLFAIKAAGDLDKDLFAKHYDTAHSYPVYANSLNNKGLYGYYKIHTYKKNKLTVTARGVLGYASAKDHDFVAVGRLLVLDPKPETNIFFFEQYINCALKICSEVTGVPQLTAPSLGTYIVSKPSLPEQTRIANFLTLFDRKIEKEKEKLGTLRMQKKGFLQQMFV